MADNEAQSTDITSSTAAQVSATAAHEPESHQRKKDFNSLPHDVKSVIVEHITRPSHLRNVCLVSSELHEIAIRYLYKNVSLDLGCANDCRLSSFVSPHNKGLRHIRQIRLYLANVNDRCNQELQASFATRLLLDFLPNNILEEFRFVWTEDDGWQGADDYSWCPWRPFSADNLLLLYKKQKRMKWLEVMDLDKAVLSEIKENKLIHSGIFESARKLALYPENTETLELAGHFITQTAAHVNELIIHANFLPPDEDNPPRTPINLTELNDTATGPGLLMRTLFASLLPFETCKPLSNVTSLRLHRINLRHAADTWCKVIAFEQCKTLRFYHCPGADSMLGQLCKLSYLPKNLRTFEFQHRDNTENEALLALDGFLCMVQGLKELTIDVHCVKNLPGVAGICKQGKTLELLNVHASNDSGTTQPLRMEMDDAPELVYSSEDFAKICKACTKLIQVSCAWPPTSMVRARSEEWKQFENPLTAKLTQLITLHISNWPNTKPGSPALPRHVYEQLLQGLATRIFELSREPKANQSASDNPAPAQDRKPGKLRLLAFGIHDKIYEREESNTQSIYIRSTALDAEGRSKIHATLIGWCLRQFAEPRSEVLEAVLGREAHPPFASDGREFTVDDADGWDDD